jgi:membrane-associated phospholipid phosphatase
MTAGVLSRRSTLLLTAAWALSCCDGLTSTTGSRAAESEPGAGSWTTWVLASGADVPVPPPPDPASAQARAEVDELHRLAANRSTFTTQNVHLWSDYPANAPWVRLNLDYVTRETKDPPQTSRGYALASVAVYDALVEAWHWKYVYNRRPPAGTDPVLDPGSDPSYPSEHAAMAGAASRVLAYLFPNIPANELEAMAEDAADSRVRGGMNYRSDVAAGLALGRAVADKIIARAQADGFGAAWDGTRPLHGPEHWEPPPGSTAPPVQPLAGTWRSWVAAPDSVRPPPPPAYGTAQFLDEARQVEQIGDHLSDEQKRKATYWAAGAGTALPPGMWNQTALDLVRGARLTLPRLARAFALLNVAEADAGVDVWSVKYTYWSPRPVNAIRDLGLDPQWKPYLPTPLFPAYVSGHSAYSSAAAEVLGFLFPGDAHRLAAMALEAGQSRVDGGIHYSSDNVQGRFLGQKVGQMVVERARRDGSP